MPFAYIQFIDKPEFGRPDHELPGHPDYPSTGGPGRPEYPSTGPVRPRPPVDPDYGIDEGAGPSQPLPPGQLPSLPAPPGDLSGKVVVLVWKPGEGWSGKVFDKPSRPPGRPDQGLPGSPPRPDQGLPGSPPSVGGGPVYPPNRPGERPPNPDQPHPQPPRPDQGLPPSAEHKPGYPEEQARWNR